MTAPKLINAQKTGCKISFVCSSINDKCEFVEGIINPKDMPNKQAIIKNEI